MAKRPKLHKPTYTGTTTKRQRYDEGRGTASERGYGSRWQKARAIWLANNPLCVQCKAEGRIVAANEVDHITPHKGNMAIFWDSDNWQSLCKPCHSKKTAEGK
jgi:5-methylcytosine-specific restriction enzyme A